MSSGPQADGRSERVPESRRKRIVELARFFAWLGIVGVGGPAAHIAMMRRRVVDQRAWVSDDEFTRMVGACALVPGPNSTEMAMSLGARRAGWRGLMVGGIAFIAPAFIIVCALAFLYEDVLTSDLIADMRRWIVPIVVAIVLHALWSLRSTAVRDVRDATIVVATLVGAALGLPELLVLLLVGIASVMLRVPSRGVGSLLVIPATPLVTPSLMKLFLVFLQIGSVIYGSGYVLLVFLDSEVVARDWITSEVLLDAISVGQFTPGPVFTTATFVGWHISGVAGALVATLGIFGPSFVFAGLVDRIVALSQRSTAFAAFLRGVSSGSIALMAVVLWRLASEAFDDALTVGVFSVALVVLAGNSLRK